MSWYGRYSAWEPRVSVGTKIARGRVAAKKLATKEGREPSPIKIEGRKIAKTFWGLKWCENLEKYRDISNRLPRGATYVRNGSVADLVIESGQVRAIVGGTEAYTVKIKIQTLKPAVWKAIGRDCAQEIDSLFDLLQGRFNDGVMQRLTRTEDGLFPHKNEISMSCTCPDSAGVCKHIAAAFYGVAARLDQKPELLFKLRNVDHLELIGHATSTANLNQALDGSGAATLADSELSAIFGIDLESTPPIPPSPSAPPAKTRGRTKRAPTKPVKRKTVKKPSPSGTLSAAKSAAKSTTRESPSSVAVKVGSKQGQKKGRPASEVASKAKKPSRKKKAD